MNKLRIIISCKGVHDGSEIGLHLGEIAYLSYGSGNTLMFFFERAFLLGLPT